jgi:hypothetical protein
LAQPQPLQKPGSKATVPAGSHGRATGQAHPGRGELEGTFLNAEKEITAYVYPKPLEAEALFQFLDH